MGSPLVSICIPTFNRAALLRQALESIRAIDYAPLEILVSDNASDDGTEALCRDLAARDSRLRYVRQPRNIGMHANHNFLIEASGGRLLGFFHDDDLYQPTIIGQYVDFLERHPDVGAVCADWHLIDDDGHVIGTRRHAARPVTAGLDYVERTIRTGRSILGCPGTLIRRAALGSARFDPNGPLGFSDFALWFEIAERHSVGHVGEPLWSYRLHKASNSRRTITAIAGDYERALEGFFAGHLRRRPDHGAIVARWRADTRRFLFWALAYEMALYYRSLTVPERPLGRHTMFEMAGYQLTPAEFAETRERMRGYRTGRLQRVALAAVEALVKLKFTWPLVWLAEHPASVRAVLGLR